MANNITINETNRVNITLIESFIVNVSQGYNFINYSTLCPKGSYLFYTSTNTHIALINSTDQSLVDFRLDTKTQTISKLDQLRFNIKAYINAIYYENMTFGYVFNSTGDFYFLAEVHGLNKQFWSNKIDVYKSNLNIL